MLTVATGGMASFDTDRRSLWWFSRGEFVSGRRGAGQEAKAEGHLIPRPKTRRMVLKQLSAQPHALLHDRSDERMQDANRLTMFWTFQSGKVGFCALNG